MEHKKIYDVAILGAGASGLMAAIAAAKTCPTLTIAMLEKNEIPGRKLYVTGNGRCNVLNRTATSADYRSAEGDAAGFTAPALSSCGPQRLRVLFEELGLDTAEEEEGRLYPRSFQAASVVSALERGASGADLFCGFDARAAEKMPDGLFCISAGDGRTVTAKRLILTSGGKAGIQYGCEGRGLKIAESLGHRTVRPIPALTGFLCAETDLLQQLAGVRARGTVRLLSVPEGDPVENAAILAEDTGEIQFNKDGISGICAMNVSGRMRYREGEKFLLELDLMPEYSLEELARKLEERKETFGEYFLDALLPAKLAAGLAQIAEDRNLSAEGLAGLLKAFRLTPTASRGWKDAHTTSGGVALEGVTKETMASGLVPGLYFAGEILDVDGPCGGYSLTWAFASGWTAGENAAKSLQPGNAD